jgi:hypothetical protein
LDRVGVILAIVLLVVGMILFFHGLYLLLLS